MVRISVSKLPPQICPCGRKFALVTEAPFGPFYRCPRCGETAAIDETHLLKAIDSADRTCARCGSPMKYHRTDTEAFLACSSQPDCDYRLDF